MSMLLPDAPNTPATYWPVRMLIGPAEPSALMLMNLPLSGSLVLNTLETATALAVALGASIRRPLVLPLVDFTVGRFSLLLFSLYSMVVPCARPTVVPPTVRLLSRFKLPVLSKDILVVYAAPFSMRPNRISKFSLPGVMSVRFTAIKPPRSVLPGCASTCQSRVLPKPTAGVPEL